MTNKQKIEELNREKKFYNYDFAYLASLGLTEKEILDFVSKTSEGWRNGTVMQKTTKIFSARNLVFTKEFVAKIKEFYGKRRVSA